MSPDELVISLIGMMVAGLAWARWYAQPRRIRSARPTRAGRLVLDVIPLVAAIALFVVLKTLSAHDVRDDVRYLGLYFLLGCGWVGGALALIPFGGVSARDDVIERGNESAAWVIGGAILGVTLCFAGGNIGDGPGWWVVVFSAALATAALFVAWLLVEVLTGVSDTITIDRDRAAGVRVAGFLVACGLVLGRAVAGDWTSAQATVMDFGIYAWPVLLLVVLAYVIERTARPTADRPAADPFALGVIPAIAYLVIAIVQLARLGLPA